MRILVSEIRALVREVLQESDRDYESVFKKPKKSFERDAANSGRTVADVAARIFGRESPTGTKRASLSGAKIQKWISSGGRRRPSLEGIWGSYDDRTGALPFKGVDWTVGLLFSEGARYVGSQSGIDLSAGYEYNITDPTGLRASPYAGYVYYINPRDFIQIDNVSINQRAEIFNKFRNATPAEREYYIDVFKNQASAPAPTVPAVQVATPQAAVVPQVSTGSTVAANVAPYADRSATAKAKIRGLVRQPKEYAFWAGMIGKASKGKAVSDATFVKQVLGKNYETEWTPAELGQFAQELMAMSKLPTK